MPHPITRLWQLQKVFRRILLLRQLMFLRPTPYIAKVFTLVHGVEVYEGLQLLSWWLVPYLSEDSDISGAHKLLTENVEAVG
jgi:hypothetical protein